MPSLPSIELGVSAPAAIAVVLILLAVALSLFFYRATLPAVSRRRRLTLSILRALSLALLLCLLLDPVLRLVFVKYRAPIIALLADQSASMKIVDRSGNRADVLRRLVSTDIPRALPSRAQLALYSFGASLHGPLPSMPDTLSDEVTDIAGALQSLARDRERDNIRAVILLTDGMYTLGENPLHEADRIALPVFTIGLGDTAEQRDLLVSRITANDRVYAGSSVPVDVTLKSTGYADQRVDVTLTEGGRVLDRTMVTLPGGTAEIPAQLSYTPEGEGLHRYAVHVSPLPGELTAANNVLSFSVRILRSTMRVLILAAGPSEDLSVIRQTLTEDKNLSVRVRTENHQGGFYEGPLTPSIVDSADCILTIGMPDGLTSPGTVSLLQGVFSQRRTPLLFIDGKTVNHAALALAAPSLPVTVASGSAAEQQGELLLESAYKTHPLLAVGPGGSTEGWKHLPPIFTTQTVYRLREGSALLGSQRTRTGALPRPLIALRNIAGVKSLAILGYGIWRWRLMTQNDPETATLLSSFLSAAVRWLTSREEGRPVRVMPVKDEFSRGEPVVFTAQVYNASAQPIDQAQVHVTASHDHQSMETDLSPLGNGRYEGTMEGLSAGEFHYTARAVVEGSVAGEDAGSFVVGGLNLEYLDTRMDAELLRQMAYRTGARFFTAAEAGALGAALDSLPTLSAREQRTGSSVELGRWPYALALLVLLFSTEWVLRRRSGML